MASLKYLLPSHPTRCCLDPLGICDDNNSTPTAWDIISRAISATAATVKLGSVSSNELPDLVETLVYSLHGNGSLDTQGLRSFLQINPLDTVSFYPALFDAALSLPDLFPEHEIPYMTDQTNEIALSIQQLNALLAHQMLGTLFPAAGGWGHPTFLSWYAGNNPHPMAVEGYLKTLFHHFSNLPSYMPSMLVRFLFFGVSDEPSWERCDMPMRLNLLSISEECEPSQLLINLPDHQPPAILVSSNRQPGFGPSGTQEERAFATSVLLCPLVLFCPVLPPHAALIISPTPIHAAWRGHNRTARLTSLYPPSHRPSRYHVFVDALELDVYDRQHHPGLPDLAEGHVERELRKFYAGCAGLRALCAPSQTPVLQAGAWGCGAFGGNAVVKATLMAMAASRADVALELRMREDRGIDVELIARILEVGLTVGRVMSVLRHKHEGFKLCKDGDAFTHVLLQDSSTLG